MVLAGISVGQSLVLLAILGEGARTDAFLAAYSLSLPIALLAATLRGQLLPLFGPAEPEARFRERAVEICSRVALLGAALAIVLAAVSPLAGRLVTRGLPAEATRTAVLVLLVLAPVAYMQFRAATLSALLAGARRFDVSASLYVGAGLLGLAMSAVLLSPVGPVGAALGLGIGAATLLGGHVLYVRRFGIRLTTRRHWITERGQWMLSVSLAGYAALGLSQQLNLSIALGAVSSTIGTITVYTLSFLMIGLLINVSSMTLSLVLLPDLVNAIDRDGRGAAVAHLERVSRLAFVVLVPLLVAYLVEGRAVLHWLLAPLFTQGSVELLYGLGRIFCVMAIPLALTQAAVSIAVALRRWRLILAVAGIGITLQLLAVNVLWGHSAQSVAWAHVAAATVTAALLLAALFGRDALLLCVRLVRSLVACVALAAPLALLAAPLRSPTPLVAIGVVVAGFGCYLALLNWLWPTVGRMFLRRRSARTGGAGSAA